MIALTNIVKRFGQTEVLRGVSLTVAKGEVCVLLGPSGGGKSTLLRTINGLETFDEGEIRVDDLAEAGAGSDPRRGALRNPPPRRHGVSAVQPVSAPAACWKT